MDAAERAWRIEQALSLCKAALRRFTQSNKTGHIVYVTLEWVDLPCIARQTGLTLYTIEALMRSLPLEED